MTWFSDLPRIGKIGVVVLVVLILAGVGSLLPNPDPPQGDATDAATPTPSQSAEVSVEECDERLDPTSGRALCEFEGSASYDYRAALAESVDEVLPMVQAIVPSTEEQDLTDLYGTCDDLLRGAARDVTLRNAVTRFSNGPDEQVSASQAADLVRIARSYVCPS